MRSRGFLQQGFRWFPAAAATLLLFVLLHHRSGQPEVFGRYSGWYFTMVMVLALWVGMFWWVAMSDRLYRRITNLLSQLPVVSLATCLLAAMVLMDLTVGLYPLPLHPAVLTGVAAGALGTVVLVLFTREPREAVRIAALVAGSSLVALIVGECLLYFLARPYVRTEREFTEIVAASWPRPISIEKSPGTFRILGLADSFGKVGEFNNYHYVLERTLRSQFESGIEVVNLSVEGYEPRDQLDMLRRFGARYQPDLVLHGFFVGNDFWVPRYPLVRLGGIIWRPLKDWRRYRPRFFMTREVVRLYAIAMRDRYRKRAEAQRGKEVGTISEEDFLRVEAVRLDSCCRREPEPAVRWQETMELLETIRGEVDQMGARYVMVIHPDQIQVEDTLRQQVFRAGGLCAADYDLDVAQTFLMADCVRNGLACLDLKHAFRTRGAEGGLYLLRDTHYNETGNHLAAAEISRFLLHRGIVPSSGS